MHTIDGLFRSRLRTAFAVFMSFVLCFGLFYTPATFAYADTVAGVFSNVSKAEPIGTTGQGGACLAYAYAYAETITSGTQHDPNSYKNAGANSSDWTAKNMSSAFTYKTIASDKDTLSTVYDAVVAGKPTILYVSTNAGGSHWVCVVGVQNVNDKNSLTLANFLMLDSTYSATPVSLGGYGYTLRHGDNNVRISNATTSFVASGTAGNSVAAVAGSNTSSRTAVPTIGAFSFPDQITQGKPIDLNGVISSDVPMTSVTGSILSGTTVLQSKTTNAGGKGFSNANKTFTILNSDVDNGLSFGKLTAGTYVYSVTAKTAAGTTKLVNVTFKVVSATSSIKLPTISGFSFSSPITQGKSVNLNGVISSDVPMTSVTGSILSGTTVLQSKTTNAGGKGFSNANKTFTILNSDVDNGLSFGKLTAGTYVYRVSATNAGGTATLVDTTFKVEASSSSSVKEGVPTWSKANGPGKYSYTKGNATTTVSVPGATAVGIDVSSWQGKIDWAKVKADGVGFAILRARSYSTSSGASSIDSQLVNNVKGCIANNIPFGVYIYSYATDVATAKNEANLTLSYLSLAGATPSKMKLPVYFDMELQSLEKTSNRGLLADMAASFNNVIVGAGYKVGIYANKNWWTNYLTDSVFATKGWSKWTARYSAGATSSGVSNTDVWQFSDAGKVNGISGNVDMDFAFKSVGSMGSSTVVNTSGSGTASSPTASTPAPAPSVNTSTTTTAVSKVPLSQCSVSLTTTNYTYNGTVRKPGVNIKYKGATVPSSNYTVTYSSGRKYVGSYKVTVQAKGNKYSGSVTKTFTINPAGVSLSKLSKFSKGFTAKWYKRTTQTSGYQIRYSTSSNMSGAKTVTVSKNTTLSKKISKLKGKKRYYVQVRTYKTVSGVKYYSGWSGKRYVTTKK